MLGTELLLSSRRMMTLGVEIIFWFISHTMSYQPKGLELHIFIADQDRQAYDKMLV
jgi:hypothetical protein